MKARQNRPTKRRCHSHELSADEVKRLLEQGSRNLPLAKILWVDDHPINNQIARLALAPLGIYCDSYTKTSEAIEAIRWNAQDSKRPYDLVISDLHRDDEYGPGGRPATGMDTYEQVRAIPGYRSTPFVFFTATGTDEVLPIVNLRSAFVAFQRRNFPAVRAIASRDRIGPVPATSPAPGNLFRRCNHFVIQLECRSHT